MTNCGLEARSPTKLKKMQEDVAKTWLYDRHRDRLNDWRAKVIARMFRERSDGFKGGLSTEIYMAMAGSSHATATRDFETLVGHGAPKRTGERCDTRNW